MIHIQIGCPIEIDALRAELPEGIEVHDTGQRYYEFDDTGFSLFLFTLGIVASIPASVAANAIYDAIKKRSEKPPTRLMIDKQQLEFDRGEITRIIRQRLEFHRGGHDAE